MSPEVEVELAQRKRAQLDTELKLQKAKLDSDKLKKSSSTEIYSLKETVKKQNEELVKNFKTLSELKEKMAVLTKENGFWGFLIR